MPQLLEADEVRLQRTPRVDFDNKRLRSLEGEVRRVDYTKREIVVAIQDQLWHFVVAADCQLWFDDRRALFRCFQPTDHIQIFFAYQGGKNVAHALFAWESAER